MAMSFTKKMTFFINIITRWKTIFYSNLASDDATEPDHDHEYQEFCPRELRDGHNC